MTEQAPALTRHDFEAKIIKRCWKDEEFRRRFTADPAGTAAKYLGALAASLPKIVIHEEPAGSWHIVLPPRPTIANELSEQDIESVAGGTGKGCASALITVLASIAATASAAASGAVTDNVGW